MSACRKYAPSWFLMTAQTYNDVTVWMGAILNLHIILITYHWRVKLERSKVEFDLSSSWNCYVPQCDTEARIWLRKVRSWYCPSVAKYLVRNWNDTSSCREDNFAEQTLRVLSLFPHWRNSEWFCQPDHWWRLTPDMQVQDTWIILCTYE